MSIAEKLNIANDKVPKVYDAGKSLKEITDFSYFFYNSVRLELIDYVDTSNSTNFASMFSSCNNLRNIPSLNTSKGDNFGFMFQYCVSLTAIPPIDTSNGTGFTHMFYNCSKLKTISLIDVSGAVNLVNFVSKCTSLENISFVGSINVSISFSNSSKLTVESIQSIINALSVYSGTSQPTLTLNSASWTAIEAVTPPDGYSTWKEYITNYKNWKYA